MHIHAYRTVNVKLLGQVGLGDFMMAIKINPSPFHYNNFYELDYKFTHGVSIVYMYSNSKMRINLHLPDFNLLRIFEASLHKFAKESSSVSKSIQS